MGLDNRFGLVVQHIVSECLLQELLLSLVQIIIDDNVSDLGRPNEQGFELQEQSQV